MVTRKRGKSARRSQPSVSPPARREPRSRARPAVVRTRARGPVVDEQEVKALLKFGERRDVEIKGPGSVDDLAFLGRVARAALALSNHRDGGFIIIGAVQIAGSASFGLSPMNAAQLAGW